MRSGVHSPSSARLLCATVVLLLVASAQANTLVDIQFNLGLPRPGGVFDTVRLELFDSAAPVTVNNFLRYAADPGYDRSIMHRLVHGFVLQGGGFYLQTNDQGEVVGLPPIPTYPPIVNEFSPDRSNVRGTVAMAKLGGDPNSATSQWFFNLRDNSANLDNQNGGFTVFARVVGEGMTLIDAFGTLPAENLDGGGVFSAVPMLNREEFLFIEQMSVVGKAGDADGNGIVNIDDYFRLDRGEAQRLTGFANGDFDGDRAVDADDYAMIDRAFAAQPLAGPAAVLPPSTVPEPAAGALLAVMTLAMRRRPPRGAGLACRP